MPHTEAKTAGPGARPPTRSWENHNHAAPARGPSRVHGTAPPGTGEANSQRAGMDEWLGFLIELLIDLREFLRRRFLRRGP